jgi:hypothetical protein
MAIEFYSGEAVNALKETNTNKVPTWNRSLIASSLVIFTISSHLPCLANFTTFA